VVPDRHREAGVDFCCRARSRSSTRRSDVTSPCSRNGSDPSSLLTDANLRGAIDEKIVAVDGAAQSK